MDLPPPLTFWVHVSEFMRSDPSGEHEGTGLALSIVNGLSEEAGVARPVSSVLHANPCVRPYPRLEAVEFCVFGVELAVDPVEHRVVLFVLGVGDGSRSRA